MRASVAALAAWDRQILSNRHALLEVEGELKGVAAGQEALERKLFLLETHQKVRKFCKELLGWHLPSHVMISHKQQNVHRAQEALSANTAAALCVVRRSSS